jgi:hypothetical protein
MAVGGMVSRMAYHVYVFWERIPFEQLVELLTRLWLNALKITPDRSTDPLADA